MKFRDRVVIVTGASSGIGQAISLAFAREGADLVVASRTIEGSDTPTQIEDLGRQVLAVNTDLGEPDQVAAVISKAIDKFGRIDVLVNNGWWMNMVATELSDMEPEAMNAQLRTFEGTVTAIREVRPHMQKQKYGRIINITSVGGKVKNPMWPVYGALKAGLAHFTRCAGDVLARDGITINCVGPGLIRSVAASRAFTDDGVEGLVCTIPVGRVGTYDDITRTVLFMADEDAGFINNQELTVDGGQGPY